MAKRGRPFVDDPRDFIYNLRLNNSERSLLDAACKETGMNKPNTIRVALERLMESTRKEG